MQVKTLICFGEAERVHGRLQTGPHVQKLGQRVDTYLLSVGLYLFHVGLGRQVEIERDAVA